MAQKGYVRTEMDMKLLVLYVLHSIRDAIPLDVIIYAVTTDPAVPYMSLIECVGQLVDTQHVRRFREEGQADLYCISPLGEETLSACMDEIRPSVREKAALAAEISWRQYRAGSGVVTSTEKVADGKYVTTMSLMDGDDTLMEVKMLCIREDQGTIFENNFRQGGSKLYNAILHDLLDDYREERDLSASPKDKK